MPQYPGGAEVEHLCPVLFFHPSSISFFGFFFKSGKNRMTLLDQLVAQAQTDFSAAEDAAALENAKAKYLGKTGQITEQMKTLGKLAPDERKAQGAVINLAKEQIEAGAAWEVFIR
jgi:hypothetical protein